MKSSPLLATLAALVLSSSLLPAQMPSPSQTGINAAMMKLFGDMNSFTAQADVRMTGGKDNVSLTMDFAMLEGKIRAEIDLTQIKSKELSAEAVANLKQVGMDKMVSIVRPDLKATLVVYPSLNSYAQIPMPKEEAADLDRKYETTKTKIGQETVDGHPCEKNKVVVTGDKGDKHDATVWNATDLKGFPIQMQMLQQDATVTMTYRNLKLARADAKQFEAPAGYTKYESVEKLMQGAMMKMFNLGK